MKFLGFCYMEFGFSLSFRAGIYGTKTGLFSREIKFVIFSCSFASIAAALRRLSNCGLTQAVFLRYFWNFIIMGFGLPPEFSCLNLWHENGHVFAEDKFVILACSSASIAAALRRLSGMGLTQAVLYGIFEVWLIGFGVKPEFDCLNLWQSNG